MDLISPQTQQHIHFKNWLDNQGRLDSNPEATQAMPSSLWLLHNMYLYVFLGSRICRNDNIMPCVLARDKL